jgi:hypothetical protein
MSPQDDPSMKAAVIAAPRRLALIGAASFLVPLSGGYPKRLYFEARLCG